MLSYWKKKLIKRKREQYKKFIYYAYNKKLKVNDNVSLYVKRSYARPTFFDKDKDKGLFASNPINEGDIIMKCEKECVINDGVAELTKIMNAKNSAQMKAALSDFLEDYTDLKKIKQSVNIRIVTDIDNNKYYEAIKDIEVDEELFIMYGFPHWLMNEITKVITNYTIAGFIQFLNHYCNDNPYSENPYYHLMLTLINHISTDQPALLTCNLNSYDNEMLGQFKKLTFNY